MLRTMFINEIISASEKVDAFVGDSHAEQ